MNPGASSGPRRDGLAGLALTAMLPVTILADRGLLPIAVAGALAWFAGLCLWPRAARAQRLQFGLLSGTGLACAGVAAWLGSPVSPLALLAQNQALIGMLAAVTFLRLVAVPRQGAAEAAPTGLAGFLKTVFGLHAFGSVINMSALVIMGDRLAAAAPLQRAGAVMLSRGFSSAAFWSPFFAAMATALTYAPDAQVTRLMVAGLPLAVFALLFTAWQASRLPPTGLRDFRGYPLRIESLWLPALLAALVMLAHWWLPDWRILSLITLLAPTLTFVALLLRDGADQSAVALGRHLTQGLPGMHGELLLFLAAGVLGAGLLALGTALRGELAPLTVDAWSLCVALVCMTLAALIGVHPVVSIAATAAAFGPLADPTPVAFTYLMAWGIGAAASPLSGIHLLMQGRYGFNGYTMMRWNLSYTLVMTLGAALAISLIA